MTQENNTTDLILRAYDRQYNHYKAFTKVVEKLVGTLLNSSGIRVNSVTARVKEKDHLKDKIEKKENKYQTLDEITDNCGIRIITYFADDVDSVSKIITKEFRVDEKNSVDKGALLDPDRFGYISFHYVVNLSPERLRLPEYTSYSDCKCEIQIRSILQHAWAEIQHDLGYKSKLAIPQSIQRRFSRLAGLLEIGDDEFIQIRKDITEYEKTVDAMIQQSPNAVEINQMSLLSFITNSSIVTDIENEYTKQTTIEIAPINQNDIPKILAHLHAANIRNIQALETELIKNRDILFKLMIRMLKIPDNLTRGMLLLWLCYAKILQESPTEGYLDNFFVRVQDPSGRRHPSSHQRFRFYARLIESYNEIINSK